MGKVPLQCADITEKSVCKNKNILWTKKNLVHKILIHPQSLRDSPGGARGKVSPKPLRSLRASRTFHPTPQSLCDSPGGARGKVSPKPLRSLRASRTFHPTPSRFATAPVGHGERFPRNPFGRFAPSPTTLKLNESQQDVQADEDEDRAADQLRRTAEAAAYSLTTEHSADHGKHGHNEDGGEVHHHLAGRD